MATDPVYRSPADLLRLVVAAVGVVALLLVDRLFGNAVLGFLSDVLSGVARLPSWFLTGIVIGTRVLTTVILVAGAVAVVLQRRIRLLVMAGAGALAGSVLSSLLCRLLGSEGAMIVPVNESLGYLSGAAFPSRFGLGAAAGAVTACAPWLSRRWRQLAWTMLVGLAACRFTTAPVSFDTAMALAAGWLAGAAVLLATGGPSRRPAIGAVIQGLTSVGLPLAELRPADVDARGSTPYFGSTTDGGGVFVKVLGTDERDADLLFRLYRRLRPRDLGDEKPFSSLRRTVEHEALVSLAARGLGVPTPEMLAFASVEPNAFVLAYAAVDGRSLDRVDAPELTDDLVAELWRQLGALRSHRIAHRDLRLANLFLTADREIMLIDFGFSELSASDLLLATDVAELLASLALTIGAERSCATATTVIGADAVRSALPRLRPFALSGATRTGLKASPDLLPELRRRVTAATELVPPAPTPG